MSGARICDGCGKTIANGTAYTILHLEVLRVMQGAPNRAVIDADVCGDTQCAAAWFASKNVTGELFVTPAAAIKTPKPARAKR